jgi:hypothetical protein
MKSCQKRLKPLQHFKTGIIKLPLLALYELAIMFRSPVDGVFGSDSLKKE